ncbi:hypothetical protein DCAR_0727639 [Daucus carota subsp. sativus]|uniref:Cytochrome P450 n=2 Tax=Daucus carota subsp. sativus TaxID=79200 RepID=A0AAF0XJG6_DAUCS|nr:hypothetical protein DCAR_0727639 [Daucus carota subsp. sativus]
MEFFFSSAVTTLIEKLNLSDVAFSLFCLFVFSSLVQKLTSKGPMLWPLVGIFPTMIMHCTCLHEWITKALIDHRGTVPFRGLCVGGICGIVTADPVKIEYMLKSKFHNFPKGRYYRERFTELLGQGIFNADDQSWKHQRQAAATVMHSVRFVEYSTQSMQDLVHKKLLKVLENLVESKVCIDLQELLLRFTFDNICVAAFGVDPGCLSIGLPDVPFAKAFEEATESTLCRFIVPPFVWKTLKFFDLGFERRLKNSVKVVHDFADKTVQERKEELAQDQDINLDEKFDLLSRLINLEKGNKNGYFSDKLLEDFCISFILAGRDTSSVGLAWFFWLVSTHPHVEKNILQEIHDILSPRQQNIQTELNSNIIFTTDELHKMVYLQAALSESLRLYPPVPFDFKEVLEDDVFPDGTRVKRGEKVLYSIFSMARMESVWGTDCREFKPERWIKEGAFVSENPFKYAVFNGGPRLCVGKKFAYTQMKMVTASILARYSIQVVEGFEVAPKTTTTLYMKNGLMVKLVPRN